MPPTLQSTCAYGEGTLLPLLVRVERMERGQEALIPTVRGDLCTSVRTLLSMATGCLQGDDVREDQREELGHIVDRLNQGVEDTLHDDRPMNPQLVYLLRDDIEGLLASFPVQPV